ncbi:MAG: sulfotransferase [Planctomycetota bacterium]|nr:sulfotransferase [Planctomycetota bacterium]
MSTAEQVTPPNSDEAPIFVVGTGRSGTTLLRLMINAHPRIHLTHEASFYIGRQFIPKRYSASDWLELYFKSFPFAWQYLRTADVREELAKTHPGDAPREALPDAYKAIMRCKAHQRGCPRYGDKTPFHASYIGTILKDFPGARIIHILRDPRPTCLSLQDMPWAPGSWILNNRYMARLAKEIGPYRDQMHEVRLEDLLANPEGEMRSLLDFVGEEWDARVLDHTSHIPPNDVPPFPWLLTATQPRGKVPTRHWAEKIPPAWIRQIEFRNRFWFETYGYPLAELENEPTWGERFGAVWKDFPEAGRFLRRFLPLARRLASKNPPDAAEAQHRLLHLNPKAWDRYPDFEFPERPVVE